jgi:hypothetical protein
MARLGKEYLQDVVRLGLVWLGLVRQGVAWWGEE